MQRSCSKHQVSSSCMSILHPVMSSGPGSTQTHGLPGDTFASPEHSTDSVDSQSHTKLSSEDVEEETKHQGSKVSNARPFTHKSLVTTHQDVTCASFSPTMQVPSEPAGGESDPHEEPEPAAVKGECRVAVCLSMLVPTTNMRRGDADMLHHSLPTLTTAVSLVCLYLCIQHTVRGVKKLSSTGAGTDTDTGTDTAQLIIRKGAETGGATGVGKIRTVRNVKRQKSANCLRIPANTISYLNKLRKVRRSGVISRSLVRCCRYESSFKHFIFFAHRMSLRLAIRATQEEAGERTAM